MKTFFTILLYLLVIILIGGIIFGVSILLDRPLEEAALIFGLVLALWLLIILIKKLIIYYRARAQALRILKQEHAERDADLGMSPQQLNKNLKKRWNSAVKSLRKSHLKLKGDPLYVLPWYMVFGKPASGKSTALKNAKLLSPAMDLSSHEDGSTLNLEWWLYDQAIVIDTAGRYAVPDVDKRDRKEWATLLQMLSRHKQKEPLNGLVLVVTADRLLNNTEEQLIEEGLQIRTGINDLMEQLEIRMPVYLMVTKCDLVDQFRNWCQYLPEESLDQVMGYLCEEEVTDIDSTLDFAFDKVLDRIKELRLLMMERGNYPDDSLIELPINLEKLRKGLHAFAQTALKNNLYQETPKFRGLYFSSSQQVESSAGDKQVVNKGHFLHHLFTKVMPPDRGLLSTLPSAERIRRAVRNYGFSVSGAVLVALIVSLTSAYIADRNSMREILEDHSEINLKQRTINLQMGTLNRLIELTEDLAETEHNWTLPWYGFAESSPQRQQLRRNFLEAFKKEILNPLDDTRLRISDMTSEQRAFLVSGIVRRLNLVRTKLEQDVEAFEATPDIPAEYLTVVSDDIIGEASLIFTGLYRKYIDMQNSMIELNEEQSNLQAMLQGAISGSHGDFEWLIKYTNLQGFDEVKVGDFWVGSRQLYQQPTVEAAYTLEGRDFIIQFLDELNQAGAGSSALSSVRKEFMTFYERNYLKAWQTFAENFDVGKKKLRNRKEWLNAVESMFGQKNPYFAVLRKIESEVEPVFSEGLLQARGNIELFAEIQEMSGDEAPSDGKANKKATKAALKVIGKFGKAGKLVAKAGKKGMKAQKKFGGAGGAEVTDEKLEQAAKEYQSYKQALKDLAFNADSSKLSYKETATYFESPDEVASGDGAGALAWASIENLQKVLGEKPTQSTRIFWDLYQGPIRLAYEYMQEETSCYLQEQWENQVLVQLEELPEDAIGKNLVREGGLLWSYVEGVASPFLDKKNKRGFLPRKVEKKSIQWDAQFLKFVNSSRPGRYIVDGEFDVKINTLPTGVNQNARISPYATFIDLHCGDKVQTLANYNYSASDTFKWSLSECGDLTLRIEVGEFSLRKTYEGQKGFPRFLADFRDGRKIIRINDRDLKDFEDSEDLISALRNESVSAIDVNYEFSGQQPVIRMLDAVPSSTVSAEYSSAAACWTDEE
jgi:type VI secretion system protein ImpL